jgi:hypothetical protein
VTIFEHLEEARIRDLHLRMEAKQLSTELEMEAKSEHSNRKERA